MTPKEKAKELFVQFFKAIPSDEMGKDFESANKCALIAVDEILKILISYAGKEYDYYLEVKQEIEKL